MSGSTLIYDGIDHPVEVASGQGDLRYSSTPMMPPFAGAVGARSVITAGGRHVSYAQIFCEQPWVGAAVNRMLSWSVRVPLKMYRRTGDDSRIRLFPKDHPLAAAISSPWAGGSPASLTMSLLGPTLVHGNGLDEVLSGARESIAFKPCDWRFARPIKPWRDTIAGWDVDVDDPLTDRTVPADTMLHITWWSPMGPTGVSPLQQLGTTIGIEDAAQRHQKSMLANGARPPSAVTATDDRFFSLEPDEREAMFDDLREDIAAIYAGPENSGRPALLPPGLDWKQVGHTAVEAELIDQRKIAREEVCGVYLIPPPMLGILDRATFSNIEVQREMAYSDSLAPPLVLIEQSMNAQILVGLLGETDLYVEFDFNGVLRGNRLTEVQALREAVSTALLTPNEARAIDNRPKSNQPGMDSFYLPLTNNLDVVNGQSANPEANDTPNEDDTAPTGA